MNHHAGERDLIEVMVQDLTKWTAVVSATGLLAVNGIDRLVPKVSEPTKKPYPAWQRLSEGRVQHTDSDQTRQRENQSHESEGIGRQPVWKAIVSQECPERIIDCDFERGQAVRFVPVSFD